MLVSRIEITGKHNAILHYVPLAPSGFLLDLRVSVPLIRHILQFDIPLSASTESDLCNPDKDALHQTILDLRANGMSYRQIDEIVGLHWTRVSQIARMESR